MTVSAQYVQSFLAAEMG